MKEAVLNKIIKFLFLENQRWKFCNFQTNQLIASY